MKICHTITTIDKYEGGTSTYLQSLANELVKYSQVSIATLHSPNPLTFDDRISISESASLSCGFQGYSRLLKKNLSEIDIELFHGNGLWQYPVHAMSEIAYKRKIPYIISPHGMIEPWALKAGKWKKKLAMALFQRKDLKNAFCIHATAQSEADNIRNLGFTNPIAVIPNGIDVSEFPIKNSQFKKGKRTILFLSRIHQKKGIEILIKAWGKLDKTLRQNWQVEIAGNGEESYIASLQKLIDNKALSNEIRIIGPKFGTDKLKTYHRADIFVLPTYSENFGIVVAEALACGIPVITTNGTPWEELNMYNAGWWIDIGVDFLLQTLQKAMSISDFERKLMGQNGRKLIEDNYSIESVTKQMIELYDWVLGKTLKPSFVKLD